MASKYDWDFIRPLDQTANIAALGQGNQQINAGLAAMANSVGGIADTFRQRNTDEIMNALFSAQNSQELPAAMQAVQALQQQYGRGYDQTAVRNAVDTRGSTLGARDLQNINLQQAQAAQAAIPNVNAFNAAQMQAAGASPEQIAALGKIQGIDNSSMATSAISGLRSDRTYDRGVFESDRNFKRQGERDIVNDAQWAEGNRRANIGAAADLAKNYVTPASTGYSVDANGNITTTSTAGVKFSDALPTIMGSIFNTESNNTHRQRDGSLTRSPAGALGVAQIMPATAAKPGYGMKPINLQTSSADEQKAWATDYIGRIQKAHNFTTEQAVAAYNAGAGSVQKAIKDGGANWLSRLPKETQNYVPKVLGGGAGKQSNASIATQVAQSAGIPQATMSKVTTDYQQSIAKLNADYGNQRSKEQLKGSVAATGKNVDTWVAGKKESSWTGNSDNPIFTKAGDLGKMARQDQAFNNLPADAQVKVLDGVYGYLRNSGTFERVPNEQLRNFINRESKQYQTDRVNQFNQGKEAAFEAAYQNLVGTFQQAGSMPPNRESARQLLDPSYKPKPQQAAPQPRPQPVPSQAAQAVAPRQGVPSLLSNAPNQRAQAVAQGRERATNVANMPTQAAMKAMKEQALAKANTAKQKEATQKAFAKLEEDKKKKTISPSTRKLLEEFGGGLLR